MSSDSAASNGVSVVTTTWNERENIEQLISRIRVTLRNVKHEIIVVDDSSKDGTLDAAKPLADVAVSKHREGQTKGLLYGAKLARYPIVVTIDSDLENSPELIPALLEKATSFDVVVASRTVLPRISERWAAKTLGRLCGVHDFYSNFRLFKREALIKELKSGETFGGELLVWAKRRGFRVGEVLYVAPPRRSRPRIGGNVKANGRIIVASLRCFWRYCCISKR
ncbi:MAG: glycosyltransferase [Candidatus Bathyarchaeota archaeon]|nr:glycosyltransferase [Candidatus Bathyarchaeota archaeon]